MNVSIIDTPGGNIGSVKSWLERSNFKPLLINHPDQINDTDLLVFPGNGTFNSTLSWLDKKGLKERIKRYVLENKYFIGICMGMHIMFEKGEEGGISKGVEIMPGTVKKLEHVRIGWEKVEFREENLSLKSDFYFMHSYGVLTKSDVCKKAIIFNNAFLFQFHPEKSGPSGDDVLKQIKKIIYV